MHKLTAAVNIGWVVLQQFKVSVLSGHFHKESHWWVDKFHPCFCPSNIFDHTSLLTGCTCYTPHMFIDDLRVLLIISPMSLALIICLFEPATNMWVDLRHDIFSYLSTQYIQRVLKVSNHIIDQAGRIGYRNVRCRLSVENNRPKCRHFMV